MKLSSHLVPVVSSAGRDGSVAGAVDEEDFIQAFEDVPTVQVRSLLYPTFQHELVLLIMLRSFLFSSIDLLQQGGRGGHDEDSRRAVR